MASKETGIKVRGWQWDHADKVMFATTGQEASDATTIAANTAVPGLIRGTPVVTAIPDRSLVESVQTDNADYVLLATRAAGGNSQEVFRVDSSAGLIVFNEASNDWDFRIETDLQANAFVLDAGADTLTLSGVTLSSTSSIKSTSATLGIGYGTGAGGAVVQATSKVTAFTLSKVTGTITFAGDALAGDANAASTWTNTAIAATDVVIFNHISGGTIGAYRCDCAPGAGTATVNLHNLTAGSLSEAPVFAFAIIKGVTA